MYNIEALSASGTRDLVLNIDQSVFMPRTSHLRFGPTTHTQLLYITHLLDEVIYLACPLVLHLESLP